MNAQETIDRISGLLKDDPSLSFERAMGIVRDYEQIEQNRAAQAQELKRCRNATAEVIEEAPGKPGQFGMRPLWDTTEVCTLRLRIYYHEGYPPGGDWSIGYIVSRKHKKIIGIEGGGWCALDFDKDGNIVTYTRTDTDAASDIKKCIAADTMVAYLKAMP